MIYTTSREILTALLEGKVLKTTTEVYNIYRDKFDIKYIKMMESGKLCTYDQETKLWLNYSYDNIYGGDSWIEGEPIPTKTINGIEFPEPEEEPLEYNTTYYVPVLSNGTYYSVFVWNNTSTHKINLNRGLVQLTQDGAIAQAKALYLL